MKNITILIIGSKGFVGKNLVNQLGSQYSLLTPSHSELDLLDGDAVREYFKKHSIEVVINCAVVGGSRVEEREDSALSKNLRIFFNIVNNEKYYHKLIHLGSGAEYDKSKPIKSVKEIDFGKKIPTDDYGLFKYTCSKYIEQSSKITCLRIFGLYGKHEDYRYRFISNAIYQNMQKLPITISQNVYFSYLYIDDFVKIVDYFINHEATDKFYNLGTGSKIDLYSLAKIINTIAESKSKIIIKKTGLNNEYTCDNTRLVKEIPNLSFTKPEEGIQMLFQWYKNENNLNIS